MSEEEKEETFTLPAGMVHAMMDTMGRNCPYEEIFQLMGAIAVEIHNQRTQEPKIITGETP